MNLRCRRLGALSLSLVAAVLVAGCSSSKDDKGASTTTAPTVAAVDTTVTTVPFTIAGTPRTTTTVVAEIAAGQAGLNGTVSGVPDLTGVVVRVEHFVGDAVATTEVPVNNGNWALDNIPGGRYRVTAFRLPDLGQAVPEAFFLRADESRTLNLVVVRVGENTITAGVNPSPPPVGLPFRLTVQLGSSGIDASGQFVSNPRTGVPVQLTTGDGLEIESEPAIATDGSGRAAWQLRCTQEGPVAVFLVVGTGRSPVNIPPCGG